MCGFFFTVSFMVCVFVIIHLWSYICVNPCWNPSLDHLCTVHFGLWCWAVGWAMVSVLGGAQLSADHIPASHSGGSKLPQHSSQQASLEKWKKVCFAPYSQQNFFLRQYCCDRLDIQLLTGGAQCSSVEEGCAQLHSHSGIMGSCQ